MVTFAGTQDGEARATDNGETATAFTVPFIRASDENIQPGSLDSSESLGTDLGVTDVPAYGYIRWLDILVEATGGAAGLNSAVASEDAPFNVLQNIALTEPNGAPIVQLQSGYSLFLANKLGGYNGVRCNDPRANPIFLDVDTDGDFTFHLRVPVEISARDAVGSLANQDSAGQFKIRATLADAATLYTTSPDTLPTVRVRAWLSAWDQPEPTSGGLTNTIDPPASGTTSYWTVQSGITVANGENTIELKRKGNYLRQLIFVLRTSGSRATADTDWPTETRFMRDAYPARYYNDSIWRTIMWHRTGFDAAADAANGPENGVRFHDYMHEFNGVLGFENRDLWQPTRGSTRLEIVGNFQAGSTLDIITNDVAIADDVFL